MSYVCIYKNKVFCIYSSITVMSTWYLPYWLYKWVLVGKWNNYFQITIWSHKKQGYWDVLLNNILYKYPSAFLDVSSVLKKVLGFRDAMVEAVKHSLIKLFFSLSSSLHVADGDVHTWNTWKKDEHSCIYLQGFSFPNRQFYAIYSIWKFAH